MNCSSKIQSTESRHIPNELQLGFVRTTTQRLRWKSNEVSNKLFSNVMATFSVVLKNKI